MRLGIFGGSFDPPHLGHLLPLIDAAEQLELDSVRFVPAATQPFKVGRAYASAEHRLAMTERLVERIPGFVADPTEIGRAGLSFTVDTLSEISEAHPSASLVLLLGADTFAHFDLWREPQRIRSLATIAVLARGIETISESGGRGVKWLGTRRVDISSTELRARVAVGRTLRGFMPDAVADYIDQHRLYR